MFSFSDTKQRPCARQASSTFLGKGHHHVHQGVQFEPQVPEPCSGGPPISVQRCHPSISTVAPSPQAKRHYTTRGAAGTCPGRQPPTNPEKLKELLKAKAAHEKVTMELMPEKTTKTKTRRCTTNQEYHLAWHRAWHRPKAARSVEATSEWHNEMAKQVAECAPLF